MPPQSEQEQGAVGEKDAERYTRASVTFWLRNRLAFATHDLPLSIFVLIRRMIELFERHRRMIELFERHTSPLYLLFLDWQQASRGDGQTSHRSLLGLSLFHSGWIICCRNLQTYTQGCPLSPYQSIYFSLPSQVMSQPTSFRSTFIMAGSSETPHRLLHLCICCNMKRQNMGFSL